MAKLKEKSVMVAALLALAALLLISACSKPKGPLGGNVTCFNDSDCPPSYTNYCGANGSACLSTTIFRCESFGTTNASCVQNGGSLGCFTCPNGCVNSSCLPTNGTPDLIVKNISFQIVDNQSDVKINLTVSVMNIGTGLAGQSATSLRIGMTVVSQYQTPQLSPQQAVTLYPPATILLPRSITSTVTATADAQNQVAEQREDNNQLTVTVP